MPARTGQEYLEGLRQRRREIWLNGEQVDDVVSHPALANCAHTLAHLYDMQHDPTTRDALTYLSPTPASAKGRLSSFHVASRIWSDGVPWSRPGPMPPAA